MESQAVVSVLFFMRSAEGKAQAEAGNHQADYGDKFHQAHENALLSNHPRKGVDSRRANRPSGLLRRREPPTVFGFTNSIVKQAAKRVQLQFTAIYPHRERMLKSGDGNALPSGGPITDRPLREIRGAFAGAVGPGRPLLPLCGNSPCVSTARRERMLESGDGNVLPSGGPITDRPLQEIRGAFVGADL